MYKIEAKCFNGRRYEYAECESYFEAESVVRRAEFYADECWADLQTKGDIDGLDSLPVEFIILKLE